MSAQTKQPKDRKAIAKEIDKKKKKHLLKTFLKTEHRRPFKAAIGQIVRISPLNCKKLGVDKELFQ